MSMAIFDDYGFVFCGACGAEILCDPETGDMPNVCEECGDIPDYSDCP